MTLEGARPALEGAAELQSATRLFSNGSSEESDTSSSMYLMVWEAGSAHRGPPSPPPLEIRFNMPATSGSGLTGEQVNVVGTAAGSAGTAGMTEEHEEEEEEEEEDLVVVVEEVVVVVMAVDILPFA